MNFYETGLYLLEWLRQQNWQDIAAIYGESELASVLQKSEVVPALYLIHRDTTISERSPDSRVLRITQRWAVITVIRNYGDQAKLLAEGGDLQVRLWKALAGLMIPQVGPCSVVELLSYQVSKTAAYFPIELEVSFTWRVT